MEANPAVQVGVGVFVFKDGMFLMGERRNAHGNGSWSLPGGHQEFGESPEETARREVLEETGVNVTNIRVGACTNDIFDVDNKHYITLWYTSEYESGTPEVLEPHKCAAWEWRDFDMPPEPLFLPWRQLLTSEFMPALRARLTLTRHA